jgi:hypothetical protein
MDTAELIDAIAGLAAIVIGLWALSAAVWVNLVGLNRPRCRQHPHHSHLAPHARHAQQYA